MSVLSTVESIPISEQRRALERGEAAPYIHSPRTPWWYSPVVGAWAAAFVGMFSWWRVNGVLFVGSLVLLTAMEGLFIRRGRRAGDPRDRGRMVARRRRCRACRRLRRGYRRTCHRRAPLRPGSRPRQGTLTVIDGPRSSHPCTETAGRDGDPFQRPNRVVPVPARSFGDQRSCPSRWRPWRRLATSDRPRTDTAAAPARGTP